MKNTIFTTVDEGVAIYGAPAISRLMKSTDLGESWTPALEGVHSFGLEGKFLYASVINAKSVDKRVLKVSSDGGVKWQQVQLPDITPDRWLWRGWGN